MESGKDAEEEQKTSMWNQEFTLLGNKSITW